VIASKLASGPKGSRSKALGLIARQAPGPSGGVADSLDEAKAAFRQIETTMPGWGFLEGHRIGIAGLGMSLLPRKGVLAISVVIDVALNARSGPVNSRALAKNQRLGPRYLESELQALVREGILKAVRGPHGGYVLAREQRRITAADILRAAKTADDEEQVSGSALILGVVGPALAKAENAFSDALSRITIEDLARSAAPKLRKATK